MKVIPMVNACQAGEVIAIRQADGRCGEAVVKAPCRDKTNGHWYCATHREHFTNQFMKDVHISKGKHRLVWICHEHGAEQP
jgi:hypothetical protein